MERSEHCVFVKELVSFNDVTEAGRLPDALWGVEALPWLEI
jgi:hypothetical protein